MKKIFKKSTAVVFIAITMVMLTSNCTNLTNGLSTDPVNVTDPSVIDESKYMTGAQVILIGIFEGDQARQTGMWADYFDGEDRQYAGLQNYVTSGQDFDNEWVNIYTGLFKNTQLLKQNAKPTKNFVAIGIAQVMEAMSIGLAADMWGDVPYSQITQYPVITTPKFDTQASVYAAAQALLDSAITNLGLTGSAPGDFFLGGSAVAWTSVAHTVKARLYLHTRDYTDAITQAGSGISTVSGNVMATHGSAYLQTFNLYYSFLTYDRSGYMSANTYAPKLLDVTQPNSRNNAKTNETARLNYIYYPGSGLNFAPAPNTYEPNVLCDFDWGNPTNQNGFFGGTTSFPIVTFQENTLILAEALMKQAAPDPTNALAALNTLRAYYATGAHINSGYLPLGYNYAPYLPNDFAPGGIDNNGADSQNQALLREILEERFVTLIGQIEGWNDMRRTGNFLNLPLPAGKTDYPRRGLYSQIEQNTNPNCAALVASGNVGLFNPVNSFSTAY
jgi:starch-binding outer membrane protein, SusD/RagB family